MLFSSMIFLWVFLPIVIIGNFAFSVIQFENIEKIFINSKDGYKLEKTEGIPLIVQEYEGLNIIKIYYIKDEFNYTVNYYYDGEKDESATSTYTATYKDIINTYEDKTKDGYRLDRVENMPLEVSELA